VARGRVGGGSLLHLRPGVQHALYPAGQVSDLRVAQCMPVHVYVRACVCAYVRVRACVSVHACVCVFVRVCTRKCKCVYVSGLQRHLPFFGSSHSNVVERACCATACTLLCVLCHCVHASACSEHVEACD